MGDIDIYTKLAALKGTKAHKIDGIDYKKLPSYRIPKEREEEERRSKMTPEELAEDDFRRFMAGKKISGR